MNQQKRSNELPDSLRPYERCLKEGPSVLNDAELLAVILRTGTVGENSVALASRLLGLGDLSRLTSQSIPQLRKIRGIGKVKAVQIQCIGELCKRMARCRNPEFQDLSAPELLASFYMEQLCHEDKEKVILVLLNNKSQLLREIVLSVGTVNCSLISPREIFLEAFRYEAVNIALVHNHPSGDPTPSPQDVAVTRQVARAGELFSVLLVDHIIIGDHTYISLKEKGIIK
ncbi:MAG: DNA repair protein RadC [Lachnospiraceae bacterium]|nr:DNA repair protein RadC [Lachnospiraceae bacterium]